MLLTVLELISQSSNFSKITILRNGVFSPLFSKYVLFVWNKLCPPIKWLIFRRVWWLLILLTVLELISQSSNFARITILRNGVFLTFFPPIFSKYVLPVRKKIVSTNKLYPPINWWIQFVTVEKNIFAKYRWKIPFCKIVILAKLLLCERSSSTAIKWEVPRLFKILINLLVDTIFFRTRRTYLLNIGEKKVKKRHFAK